MSRRGRNINRRKSDEATGFVTEWEVLASDTIVIPTNSGGTYNCTIDWNGEAQTTCTAHNVGNSYTFASGGTKTITIEGTLTYWSFGNNPSSKDKITKVLNWGATGFTNLSLGFYNCQNLVEIVANMQTSIESIFQCFTLSSLPIIPTDFLKGCVNLTNVVGAFEFSDLNTFVS